ncbi:hypothetical protein VB735_31760 [Halotia wernerae UHCC 0503]|nr:hypothetical protein [Halotia wernerae UHCC 0503]
MRNSKSLRRLMYIKYKRKLVLLELDELILRIAQPGVRSLCPFTFHKHRIP